MQIYKAARFIYTTDQPINQLNQNYSTNNVLKSILINIY